MAKHPYRYGQPVLLLWGLSEVKGRVERVYGQAPNIQLVVALEPEESGWIVDEQKMSRSNDAIFMHCLPVRRNVIVTDGVIDSPRSVVIDEAENRLHVQKAIMTKLGD